MQNIVSVIGATGMLGEPVARRLNEDGFKVRILSRDIDKAKNMFPKSFEFVMGNVIDSDSLDQALEGCYGVHINLTGENESLGVKNIVSAASKKGLERITYISGTNAFEENTWFPVVQQKILAEKAIKESGIPYSIFCPTLFMETLTKYVRGNRAVIFGKHLIPYYWIAANDYARMVSTSYKLKNAVNKRLFIHGPEAILLQDALKQYLVIRHPEIKKISKMPIGFARMIASMRRSEQMKSGIEFMAFFEKVGERGDPTEANQILGKPQTTLDNWIRQSKLIE